MSTHKERQDRDEDKDIRRILDGTTGNGKRRRQGVTSFEVVDENESAEDDSMDEDVESDNKPELKAAPAVIQPVVIGSALQRNADGTIIAPKVRQRSKKVRFSIVRRLSTSLIDISL